MESANTWIAHPDVITSAIRVLAGSVLILGGALVGTLLYIWYQTKAEISGLGVKIERIAAGLELLTLTTSTQITEIKTRCKELHTPRREDKGLSARHIDTIA